MDCLIKVRFGKLQQLGTDGGVVGSHVNIRQGAIRGAGVRLCHVLVFVCFIQRHLKLTVSLSLQVTLHCHRMQMSGQGNLMAIVDVVSDKILRGSTSTEPIPAATPSVLTSRHLQSLEEERMHTEDTGDLQLLQFRHAVEPLLAQVTSTHVQPIAWRSPSTEEGQLESHVYQTLWNIVEQHAPGLMAYPMIPNTACLEKRPIRTACAMCCADMAGTNGTCEVCNTVLYEVSMNHMHRQHATPGRPMVPVVVPKPPYHWGTNVRRTSEVYILSWCFSLHSGILRRSTGWSDTNDATHPRHRRGRVPTEGPVPNGVGIISRARHAARALCSGG